MLTQSTRYRLSTTLFLVLIMIVGFGLISCVDNEHMSDESNANTIESVLTESSMTSLLDAISIEEVRVIDSFKLSESDGVVLVGYNKRIGLGYYVIDEDEYHWLGRTRLIDFSPENSTSKVSFTNTSPSGIKISVSVGISESSEIKEDYNYKDGFFYKVEILD